MVGTVQADGVLAIVPARSAEFAEE